MTTSSATLLPGRYHLGPSLLDFPTETLHKIFTYMTPTEAAKARLTNKKLADIGIEYIVPEVFLVLTEDSFKKCEAIAQHPKIKEHVKSLVFDDFYLQRLDRQRWEWSVKNLGVRLQYDAKWPHLFAEGPEHKAEVATYRRIVEQAGHHYRYTQDELDVAFARYQRYHREQSELLQGDIYLKRIIKLLAEFHALKNIVLDTHYDRTDVGLSPRQLWAAFGSTFSVEKYPRQGDHCFGRSEVHAILDNAHQASLRLETFTCSLLGFRFFSDKPPDYASYGRSLIHLKSLDLVINYGFNTNGFFACLSQGRVFRFLTAAPYLERLRLGIRLAYSWHAATSLDLFVGDFRWTSLVQVAIEGLFVKKKGFIEFLERHSSTLKIVELRELVLVDGTWTSIFQTMRIMLELDEVGFQGNFEDRGGRFAFDVEKTVAENSFRKNVQDYILGTTEDFQAIEAYLLSIGYEPWHDVCPDVHPQPDEESMKMLQALFGPIVQQQ